MNNKSQQVIINLKVAPKGFVVTESSLDAPLIITFPKNFIYGITSLRYGKAILLKRVDQHEAESLINAHCKPYRKILRIKKLSNYRKMSHNTLRDNVMQVKTIRTWTVSIWIGNDNQQQKLNQLK
jgi:hypothetical protein